MRWEALFEDLEGQLAAEYRRELDGEVAERTRRERALVDVAARLAGTVGMDVRVTLIGGVVVEGEVLDHGAEWLLVGSARAGSTRGSGEVLVPLRGVASIGGVSSSAPRTPAREFGLGYALRGLARDRAPVAVRLLGGGTLLGTIDIVGADHFCLAEHAQGEVRRRENVRAVTTVPFGALLAVESRR